jgi:hypothetical protein
VFPRCKNDNHKNLIFRPTSWPRLNIEERIWPQKTRGQKYYQWKSFFIIYLFNFNFSPLCTVS